MGKRKDDILGLLNHSDADIKNIERAYADSLHSQRIQTDLQVDIKNFCENLRSVLDYIAHDVRETHCATADPNARFYFPILATRTEFEAQMRKFYPGLDAQAPDLWFFLESVQPYHEGSR